MVVHAHAHAKRVIQLCGDQCPLLSMPGGHTCRAFSHISRLVSRESKRSWRPSTLHASTTKVTSGACAIRSWVPHAGIHQSFWRKLNLRCMAQSGFTTDA